MKIIISCYPILDMLLSKSEGSNFIEYSRGCFFSTFIKSVICFFNLKLLKTWVHEWDYSLPHSEQNWASSYICVHMEANTVDGGFLFVCFLSCIIVCWFNHCLIHHADWAPRSAGMLREKMNKNFITRSRSVRRTQFYYNFWPIYSFILTGHLEGITENQAKPCSKGWDLEVLKRGLHWYNVNASVYYV